MFCASIPTRWRIEMDGVQANCVGDTGPGPALLMRAGARNSACDAGAKLFFAAALIVCSAMVSPGQPQSMPTTSLSKEFEAKAKFLYIECLEGRNLKGQIDTLLAPTVRFAREVTCPAMASLEQFQPMMTRSLLAEYQAKMKGHYMRCPWILNNWAAAADAVDEFRRRHPLHIIYDEVTPPCGGNWRDLLRSITIKPSS